MRRALQLALNGEGRVSPNPMVGAVIVHGDRIIGEGFHAFYGGPHAEVNAVNSVKDCDRNLLKDSRMYVTLEPCAHYGKTPPCAELLVKTGIPEVVVAMTDPNPKVAGKGIKILEDAGIKVETGMLEEESRELNRRFMRAHSSSLPWIILKWAESADGFMAALDENENPHGVKLSSSLSSIWMHRERGNVDAILVGKNTEKIDSPKLTTRLWGGNSPKKYVANKKIDPKEFSENLRKEGATSIMVEGGPKLLESFIKSGTYDEIRIEKSPVLIGKGLKAPQLPKDVKSVSTEMCRDNVILVYRRIE